MFLKSLELYGFKSFADKTRLEFSGGTTSLLGPNGCGKSNIVDAIKWVLGEQSTKTLRATKMEDIIFNGTETRKALNVAEVSLVINNEDGTLLIDTVEVEIRRRLFRSGESEFFINRNPVRLRDIRELFFDTGVGKSAYSILEQGKIDQILSHKPEDRRYIFEEAAGITRYKQRSVEAGRKLERTEENIDQVETLFKEIKRQYDLRKGQAAKAARYRELEKEQSLLEIDVQFSTIKGYQLLIEAKEEELEKAQTHYQNVKKNSSDLAQRLEAEQQELRVLVENRHDIQNRIERIEGQLNGKKDQFELLQERYRDFLHNKEEADHRAAVIIEKLEENRDKQDEQKEVLETLLSTIEETQLKIENQEEQMSSTSNQIALCEEKLATSERLIVEEQQKQVELSTDLQTITDQLVKELDQRLSESGYSTKQRKEAEKQFLLHIEKINRRVIERKEFSQTLYSLIDSDSFDFKTTFHQWDQFVDELVVAIKETKLLFSDYGKTLPSFIDELLTPEGIITKKHAIDQKMANSHKKVDTLRLEIEQLKEEHKNLKNLFEQYREHLVHLRVSLTSYTARQEATVTFLDSLSQQEQQQTYLHEDALKEAQFAQSRVEEVSESMVQVQLEREQLQEEKGELEELLVTTIEEIESENERLNSERSHLNESYSQLTEIRSSIDKLTFHIETIHEQIGGIYTNYFEMYGKSLKEHEGRLDQSLEDVGELRERLSEIKRQIQQMGYINHMAEDEFLEIKERHDFITQQLNDLLKAKGDLLEVIREIKERSEKLFLESYQAVKSNFQQMFHRMFGGGRAELRLLDPENVLESGIDILAQPPGKKLDRLAPLSGGEKSLTAVALLFATYKVKPSPFAVLDEIDAALDDRNIGNFLSVLEEFSQTSQFIIITHNKRTVLGSQTLLGVTMEEKGVSKMISYRMGWDPDKEVIHSSDVDTGFNNTV